MDEKRIEWEKKLSENIDSYKATNDAYLTRYYEYLIQYVERGLVTSVLLKFSKPCLKVDNVIPGRQRTRSKKKNFMQSVTRK